MDHFGSLMAFLTLGVGSFLTLRLGFFQFTHLGRALRLPFKRRSTKGGVSPFRAMATALGSSVGTANIAGVAGAISLGGAGAVFWMWAAGLLGMATKLTEIVLAMLYRDSSSPPVGGPARYMERGLGPFGRRLAAVYSVFGMSAALIGTALVQSNTIAEAGAGLAAALGVPVGQRALLITIGAFASVLTGAVILGGVKRIGAFSERAVPAMALVYAAACAAVLLVNHARVPEAIAEIVRGAFRPDSAAGGAFGLGMREALRVGVARGVYSNEAGVGSGAMAHASSDEKDPVRQGLMGVFEVFADTIVICTLTALVILTSGVPIPFGSAAGAELARAAFASVYGEKTASLFLCASVLLFAFTSLVGWSFYGERCACALFGNRAALPFRAAFLLLIPAGAAAGTAFAWKLGEVFNYLMALPNLLALLLLSGEARRETARYKMFEKSPRRRYNSVKDHNGAVYGKQGQRRAERHPIRHSGEDPLAL
ncbi:MAG: sodium:alanine symporter family protein [Clostridia bacterium]|nr:sodium:alanine symporter family protein [Clostridia bacterium]